MNKRTNKNKRTIYWVAHTGDYYWVNKLSDLEKPIRTENKAELVLLLKY